MKRVDAADQQERLLHHYTQVLRKRLWLVLTILCVIITITLIDTARTRPIYQATARLLFEREHPSIIPFNEAMGNSPVIDPMVAYSSYYQTQYKLLQSRSLAQRVIQSLQLQRHPEFTALQDAPGLLSRLKQLPHTLLGTFLGWLRPNIQAPGDRTQKQAPPSTPDAPATLIDSFLARLEVKPIPDTRLVDVSFTAHDPALAAKIANALARIHIDQNLERRFAASQESVDWLNQRVQDMREKVEKAERALQRYKERHGTVSLEEHQNVVVQQLADLNSTLTNANTALIEAQTLFREMQRVSQNATAVDSIPLVANNSLIQLLKEKYATLRDQAAELEERWGPRHPAMIEIRAKMQALANELRSEMHKAVRGLATDYEVAKAQMNAIEEAFERKKKKAQQFNSIAIQYGVLKREVDTNRQLYNALLTNMKETSISSELKRNTIRIADAAEAPRGPIQPRPMSNIIRATLIGLILGVGFALLLESLDTTIYTPEEAEQLLHLPALGVIGRFKISEPHRAGRSASLVTVKHPQSQPAEAFKTLRANLLMSDSETPCKVILVTSPLPQDGKTTVAANLAVVMAQMDRRVLLIDADLRHPTLHRVFATDNHFGLSTMLLGEQHERVLEPRVGEATLHLIPAGACPSSPSELLGSDRMRRFIEMARQRYDTVILDTPPVLAVSDALVVSAWVDGIIMVLRSGMTPKAHAKRVLTQFDESPTERIRAGNR
ncbi:MAG: polysaccharide biosynthesis tyrosine autokinase, partial [Candidatus Tectomicrobia bacterium]|nr:polysaccharide biosynthesis tyrosine autokinase [Candidatus Tectomicrobia bacterium]